MAFGLGALALGGSQPTPSHGPLGVWAACLYAELDEVPRGDRLAYQGRTTRPAPHVVRPDA